MDLIKDEVNSSSAEEFVKAQPAKEQPISALVLRAARKMTGLTQQQVATSMSVSQSALSKMEHGILIPDMFQWYDFCQLTSIDELSCKYGYIDSGARLNLKHEIKEGSYHIPGKYAHHRGEAVRNLMPFFEYFKKVKGEKGLKEYFKHVHMDPDYFVNYSAQVNFNFAADLVLEMTRTCGLSKENLQGLVSFIKGPRIHGVVSQSYDRIKSEDKMIQAVVKNMDRYQVDCAIELKDQTDKHMDIAITPNNHMRQFTHRFGELGSFFCEYEQEWLKEITTYGEMKGLSVSVLEAGKDMVSPRLYRLAS